MACGLWPGSQDHVHPALWRPLPSADNACIFPAASVGAFDQDSWKTAVKDLAMPRELCGFQISLGPHSGPGVGTQRWI